MTKLELMKQCRYYNGEDTCPFDMFPASWYWDMERVYIQHEGIISGECATYVAHKFKDFDMPYNLQMVMFTSWAKTAWNLDEEIPDFYKLIEQYLPK
ncbi:MAG: hypothetical protein IKZ52_03515 [Bacteroidales bacterium]|nr:hypothetical protein [Bacteroidales bacterium]